MDDRDEFLASALAPAPTAHSDDAFADKVARRIARARLAHRAANMAALIVCAALATAALGFALAVLKPMADAGALAWAPLTLVGVVAVLLFREAADFALSR